MKKILIVFIALIFPIAATAHHGAVTNGVLYNTDELIEYDGEMIEVLWRNPHTRGRLKVINDAGEETIYEIELGPGPRNMGLRYDLSQEDFIGKVKVAGYPIRGRETHIGAVHILLPSGKEFSSVRNAGLYWSEERLAQNEIELDANRIAEERKTANGIFRTWGIERGAWVEPEEDLSRDWLSAQGKQINSTYDILEDNLELAECRQGMPDAAFDPVPFRIVDRGDHLTIESTEYNTTRTVYLNSETSPEPELSPTGFSTGRWAGDTLIITTSHVEWPYWSEWGLPLSKEATILETYSVSENGNRLHLSVTVNDHVMYNRPFSVNRTRVWTPGVEFPPYECKVDWEET